MAYSFFLDGVQLPIAPSSMKTQIKNQNTTITLINEREINILKAPGLREITFDARIPQIKYPYAIYPGGFKDAEYFLDLFKRLTTQTDSKGKYMPFRFVASRVLPSGKSLFATDMKVSLESYEIKEDAEDGFDVVVTLHLKQYEDYATGIVNVTPSPVPGEPPVAQVVQERPVEKSPKAATHMVVSGDSLWNIAKKYLGNGVRYTEIYDLNKDKIKSPNLIYAGQVLILP